MEKRARQELWQQKQGNGMNRRHMAIELVDSYGISILINIRNMDWNERF